MECVSLCLSYSEEFAMSNVVSFTDRFGFLDVRNERQGDIHAIVLTGELDLAGVADVTRELRLAETSDARRIVLDLTGLTFIDSSGVRMVVEAHARSRANGDRLALTLAPGPVQRVFDMTDLSGRLPFTA